MNEKTRLETVLLFKFSSTIENRFKNKVLRSKTFGEEKKAKIGIYFGEMSSGFLPGANHRNFPETRASDVCR